MRLLPALFLSFITTGLFAQNGEDSDVSAILNRIMSDTANNFTSFKGSYKKEVSGIEDSVFTSTISIPGTSENEVAYSKQRSNYSVRLAFKVSEKEARSTVEKWKKTLKKTLDNKYKLDDYLMEFQAGKPSKGYTFKKGNIIITIWYHDLPNKTTRVKDAAFSHLMISKNY